jgi:hypothetical protein
MFEDECHSQNVHQHNPHAPQSANTKQEHVLQAASLIIVPAARSSWFTLILVVEVSNLLEDKCWFPIVF